jgi:hypothetical protein
LNQPQLARVFDRARKVGATGKVYPTSFIGKASSAIDEESWRLNSSPESREIRSRKQLQICSEELMLARSGRSGLPRAEAADLIV